MKVVSQQNQESSNKESLNQKFFLLNSMLFCIGKDLGTKMYGNVNYMPSENGITQIMPSISQSIVLHLDEPETAKSGGKVFRFLQQSIDRVLDEGNLTELLESKDIHEQVLSGNPQARNLANSYRILEQVVLTNIVNFFQQHPTLKMLNSDNYPGFPDIINNRNADGCSKVEHLAHDAYYLSNAVFPLMIAINNRLGILPQDAYLAKLMSAVPNNTEFGKFVNTVGDIYVQSNKQSVPLSSLLHFGKSGTEKSKDPAAKNNKRIPISFNTLNPKNEGSKTRPVFEKSVLKARAL